MKINNISAFQNVSRLNSYTNSKTEKTSSNPIAKNITELPRSYDSGYYLSFGAAQPLGDEFYTSKDITTTVKRNYKKGGCKDAQDLLKGCRYAWNARFADRIRVSELVERAISSKFVSEEEIMEQLDKYLYKPELTRQAIANLKERKEIPADLKGRANSDETENVIKRIIDEYDVLAGGRPSNSLKFLMMDRDEQEEHGQSREFSARMQITRALEESITPSAIKEIEKTVKRTYKGYDDTIKAIAAQKYDPNSLQLKETVESLYADLTEKQISPFDNELFWKYLEQHDAQTEFMFQKIYGYSDYSFRTMFEKSSIDPKHNILMIDPGVMSNLRELIDFAEQSGLDTSNMSTFELREKFKEHLGYETIYRGIKVKKDDTEKTIEDIKQNGEYARVLADTHMTKQAIEYYLDLNSDIQDTIFGIINKKMKDRRKTEIVCVSLIKEVAREVPKLFNRSFGASNKNIITITTDVPKISLIKQKDCFTNRLVQEDETLTLLNGSTYNYDKEQEQIEAFVLFNLPMNNADFEVTREYKDED